MATKLIISCASVIAIALSACATQQENPFHQYSSKYNSPGAQQATTTYANHSQATTTYANYNQATPTYTSTQMAGATGSITNHECLNKEKKREIIGGAVGGTIGAIAGKKLIGGTKGTIAGAALGGAAGYGIGDKTINCDPIPARQISSDNYGQNAYQATPAISGPTSCPAGTTAQPNGTCMMGGDVSYNGGQSANMTSMTPSRSLGSPVMSAPAPTDNQYAGQDFSGTPGYEAIHGAPVAVAENTVPPEGDVTLTISGPIVAAGNSQAVDYDYSQNMISANAPAQAVLAPETRTYSSSPSIGQSYRVQQGDTVYSLSRKLCVGVNDVQQANGLNANFGIQIGQVITLPSSRC